MTSPHPLTKPRAFRRHLLWTAALCALGVALCLALVLATDPYRLYGTPTWAGVNRAKPQPERFQYQIKLAAALRARADVLIMGNSRVEIGIDPDQPLLRAAGRPFNLALAGTRVQVARQQFDRLVAAGQAPRLLVLGIDFVDFPIDAAHPRSGVLAPVTLADEVSWRFDSLFSIDSLGDALGTIRMQHQPEAPTMTAQGFNPLREYHELARAEGYHALFQQRATDYATRFARMPHALGLPATGSSPDFEHLRALVDTAAAHHTQLHVVIYPYHAQVMAMLAPAGLEGLFDAWRARVARDIAAVRQRYPEARIALWDFSGYFPYQCEAIPAKGDRSSDTRWYWEGGHFKAALGELMVRRMLGAPGADPHFGFPLQLDTLEANRARIARERQACLAANPGLIEGAERTARAALAPAGQR